MVTLRVIFLVLQCAVCFTIRVPVNWDNDSDNNSNEKFSFVKPAETEQINIPKEYFQYTAVKPQFAIDIASSHGVQSPEKLYSAYPIKPYTGVDKPSLGQHHLLDPQKESYHPYQNFVNKSQSLNYVKPTVTSFEIFHPYKAEEPYLQDIYRDPVLNKIRDDLRDSKNRLQKYENDAGEQNIENDEYLEKPDQIDQKHPAQKNIPVKFEIHRPLRHPNYYRPPIKHLYRENILNQKFKHPFHQNYVKVTPMHYHPVKNHLQRLRQQHAIKFDDERNEYPQLLPPESFAEKPDGYDIYENGKANYIELRNNLDESINKAVQENRPPNNHNIELQNDEKYDSLLHNDEEEFVPIKNYAQVRKTETTKHLPRERAFQDADSFDEIKNAPRLREAIKSTKAQVVYSEEGYEDSAYDHAGEQKHASNHEEHGGHLKENERSKGKYKIPSVSTSYDDKKGSAYRNQLLDGKKWQDNEDVSEEEKDSQDYSENEYDDSTGTDINSDSSNHEEEKVIDTSDENEKDSSTNNLNESKIRNKRQDIDGNFNIDNKTEFIESETNLNLSLSAMNQNKSLNSNPEDKSKDNLKLKYPYYFTEISGVSKDSALRYAENLKFIPNKSHGGTEFYESRSDIDCPEVEDVSDPVPVSLKKGENPGDKTDKNAEFKKFNKKQRLKGLGDKIDCFKAKYFGENPLDSPFFKEEIILSPKPISLPNINIFYGHHIGKQSLQTPTFKNNAINNDQNGTLGVLEEVYGKNNKTDILQDIIGQQLKSSISLLKSSKINNDSNSIKPVEKVLISRKPDDITAQLPSISRKKRASPFVYEPYKIIKEGFIQDSKKTTTTSNVSPLIKQLQSSRIIDRGQTKHNKEELSLKRNTNSKVYQDIDKLNRQKYANDDTKNQFNSDYDKRRGEPRYDVHQNHKAYYTPVENKTAVSLEEYEEKTGNVFHPEIKITSDGDFLPQSTRNILNKSNVAYNASQKANVYTEPQYSAASNTVRNILRTTTLQPNPKKIQRLSNKNNRNIDDEYVEYGIDSDKEDIYEHTTTTPATVTTKERANRRRYVPERTSSTTDKIVKAYTVDAESITKPKLELVTRFRDRSTTKTDEKTENENKEMKNYSDESNVPKYREKKKKLTKSTLVTDTKSYGEDDDDMKKEDVDAMIGVKHATDDYLPSYEKKLKGGDTELVEKEIESEEYEKGNKKLDENDFGNEEEDDDDNDDEDNDEGESDSGDDKDIDDDDDDDEEEGEEEDEDDDDDENDDDDDIISDSDTNTVHKKEEVTTSIPIKRTSPKSTQTFITTQSSSAELEPTPKILRKKIEIHKELPVNKSSSNISQFKQDIKEIEIIKEIPPKPRRKYSKHSEVLDLYKDENLAKDINKLGGVEIFKENLDFKAGPRHGGNYRRIESQNIEDDISAQANKHNSKQSDIETSQTETKRRIDSPSKLPNTRRNIRNRKAQNPNETRNAKLTAAVAEELYTPEVTSEVQNQKTKRLSESKNAKLLELIEDVDISKTLHGGNLKSHNSRNSSRDSKNAKYIELDDEETETPKMHGGNFKSYGSKRNDMHGGNYKSARIVQENIDTVQESSKNKQITKDKNNAAAMLSGFVRAVPILTTTPVYILDPSKRMYYYVDT